MRVVTAIRCADDMDDSSRVTVDLQRLVLTRTPLTRYTNVLTDWIFDCNEHDKYKQQDRLSQRSKSVEILTTSAQLREKIQIALKSHLKSVQWANDLEDAPSIVRRLISAEAHNNNVTNLSMTVYCLLNGDVYSTS